MGMFLFFAVLAATEFAPTGVAYSTALASVLWLLMMRGFTLPRPLAWAVAVPCWFMVQGFFGIYRYASYAFWKDFWYMSNPIVYTALGYLFFDLFGKWRDFARSVYLAAIAGSISAIVIVLLNRSVLFQVQDAYVFRAVAGLGSLMIIVGLLMRRVMKRSGVGGADGWENSRWFVLLFNATCYPALAISLSRTLYIGYVVGILITLDYTKILRRLKSYGGILEAAGILLALGVAIAVLQSSLGFMEGIRAKVQSSGAEVSVAAYETMGDISQHWRGFEGYRAVKMYEDYSLPEKLIGGGMGAQVNTGIVMWGFDSNLLPFLHNGYYFLLFKLGALGELFFGLYILQLLGISFRLYKAERTPERLLALYVFTWLVPTVIYLTWVVNGIYNRSSAAPILVMVGAAFASLAKRDQTAMKAVPHAVSPLRSATISNGAASARWLPSRREDV